MKCIGRFLSFLIVPGLLAAGCAAQPTVIPATPVAPTIAASPTPNPPTSTPSPVPPTNTPLPTATASPIPTATELPGLLVLPVDSLGSDIPWLPTDAIRPGTYAFIFNVKKPPFNNALVRRAFAAATDREALVAIALKFDAQNPRAATSFTPPEILGRDLTGVIGIPYDPARARELLAQAGYTSPGSFPEVEVLSRYGTYRAIPGVPGFHVQIAEALSKMWQENLGVKVTVTVLESAAYKSRLQSGPPEIYVMNWIADYNDPENFLSAIFHSGGLANYSGYTNPVYDQLMDEAASSHDPLDRQTFYIRAERLLCEVDAAVIPVYFATYSIP